MQRKACVFPLAVSCDQHLTALYMERDLIRCSCNLSSKHGGREQSAEVAKKQKCKVSIVPASAATASGSELERFVLPQQVQLKKVCWQTLVHREIKNTYNNIFLFCCVDSRCHDNRASVNRQDEPLLAQKITEAIAMFICKDI